MKTLIVSDIHFEYRTEAKRISFVNSLPVDAIDCIVIAGDIGPLHSLRLFAERYPAVVVVLGNHNYWGKWIVETHNEMKAVCDKYHNIIWLNGTTAKVCDITFAGTTLWFRDISDNYLYEDCWADYMSVKDGRQGIIAENERALDFVTRLKACDVFVMHHLWSKRCIDPRYAASPENRFFVCDIEHDMARLAPKLIINGHTHSGFDFMFGSSRAVCCPYGNYDRRFTPAIIDI